MEIHLALIAIGGLLLLGLVADEIGRRSKLPRVTLLALFGVAAGPSGLDLLPDGFHEWYEFLATIALTMVAFLLGGTLAFKNLRRHGREILIVSLAAVVVTAVVVGLGMVLIAGLAGLAAWAWTHRRQHTLTRRTNRSADDVIEASRTPVAEA